VTYARQCVLEHDKPKHATAPLLVCTWHADRTQQAITELPTLYNALQRRLITAGGALTGLPSGTKEPGISLNHRVVQCRTDIRANLTAWARVVINERHMTYPDDTVPAIARFLTRQLDWCLSQPYAKQLVNDVTDDWATANRLNDPNHVRSFNVGPCPEDGCEGTLVARIRSKDVLLPSDVTCDLSPEDEDGNLTHIWPTSTWMTLGRRIIRKEPA
jgi:hypothetical protein